MTKGCCSKHKIENENVIYVENIEFKDDSFFGRNEKLLDYQKLIADNPHNNSMTKRFLTKQIAMEYANIRGLNREGLGQCVFPNVFNLKCLVPYAVTPECYNTFEDFFGEIIENIHGIPGEIEFVLPNFGNITENAYINLNAHYRKRKRVLYSEIIMRRNIHGIPFTPFMKSEDRKKVISQILPKIREIFEKSQELPMIPCEWKKRINKISNELSDCGAMNDYPNDRVMIAFEDENNFYQGCILNFDDHIQYIVSVNNGEIGGLLSRIHKLIFNNLLKDIVYLCHSVFGNLTLSPFYVGTGFSIRVLAKFPFVSQLPNANCLIKPFNCEITNEIDYKNNGMIFLNTIKSLNQIESEIFSNFLLAFNKLSFLEDELELSRPMSLQFQVNPVENLGTLIQKICKHSIKSYTKMFLTKHLVRQYNGIKTRFGSLINNCIRHNAYHSDSLFPRACDSECYTLFQTFFNPILLITNNIKCFQHPITVNYGSTDDILFRIRHPNIFSYRVRFSRNIDAFPFPILMSNKNRLDVEKIFLEIFNEIPVEFEGIYTPINQLKYSVYFEEILKNKLIPSPNEINETSGLYANWPYNRGVYFTNPNPNYPDILLIILINFSDHIKLISLDPFGKKLNLCYKRAINFLKFLDLKLSKLYAYRNNYGFLTTFPNSVGCGLRISALIKLENLGNHREILENVCKAQQFAYRGSFGNGSIAADNVFDISLKLNLNFTEKWIILTFAQRLKTLINAERQFDSKIVIPSFESDEECEDKYEDDFEDDYEDNFFEEKTIIDKVDKIVYSSIEIDERFEDKYDNDDDFHDYVDSYKK